MPQLKDNLQKSILEKEISPYMQGAILMASTLLVQIVVYCSDGYFQSRTFYTVAISFVLVFAIFNAILSLSTADQNAYWAKSILSYAVLCVAGGYTAYFFSQTNIDEAGPYKWMYFVFTFGYILLLAILRTIRRIVFLAQKQDHRSLREK